MNIIFKNVSYKRKRFQLQDLSFEVREGYITALTGRNGAGKTTLFHMLMDQNPGYQGEILADGMDWSANRQQLMNRTGFVSDEQKFFMELSALENAEMLQYLYDVFSMERFEEIMAQMELSSSKYLKHMSRGEYIKFQLAFAMAHDTQIFLLDEATAGMDPVFKKEFFRILHKLLMDEHCAVLMSTHIKDDIVKHMDYVIQMEDGKLVSDQEAEKGMQENYEYNLEDGNG